MEESRDKLAEAVRAGVQFPTVGRVVHVFPNGNKTHPLAATVARVFGSPGDAYATVNVGALTPEGVAHSLTSVQHVSKAPSGATCWDWPPRA